MRRSLFLAASALALVPAAAPGAETINYNYDGQGRLVKVARTGASNASECYSYDAAGNRTNLKIAVGSVCTAGSGGGGPVSFAISSNGPVTEGNISVFTITKTGTAATSLDIKYATANGTATGSSGTCPSAGDYRAKALATLTFAATDVSRTVQVVTCDDSAAEPAETFSMALSAPSGGATITTGSATATITDNDGGGSGSSFSINDVAVTEGSGDLVFTVTKSGSGTGSLTYAISPGTATLNSDFNYSLQAQTGTLSFGTAVTTQTVTVKVIDDTAAESPETVKVDLSSPSLGATISDAQGIGTINDNDSGGGTGCSGVSFSVNNADATEADPLVFTVSKAGSTSTSCSVTYATANGTAVSPSDFTGIGATVLTFTAAQTSKTVSVTTNSNGQVPEPDETMYFNLSSAIGGATISDAQGVGTIYDDGLSGGDPCPTCRSAPSVGDPEAPVEAPAEVPPDATSPPLPEEESPPPADAVPPPEDPAPPPPPPEGR